MRLSALIIELQKALEQRGDLLVTAEDGLNPSEEHPVQEVEYSEGYFFTDDGQGGEFPHFYIR